MAGTPISPVGTQIKSPVQLIAGTFRHLGVREGDFAAMARVSALMGQDLFQPPNVKGWDGGRAWINASRLFARQNFSGYLVEGKETLFRNGQALAAPRRSAGTPQGLDLVALLGERPFANSTEVVEHFLRSFIVVPVSDSKRRKLIDFLDRDAPLPPSSRWTAQRALVGAKLRGLAVLIMSMPEYQLC